MEEKTNVAEVVEEIRSADEETLRSTIEKWFESTRTAGMKIGAQFISAAIFGIIQKHTKKAGKVSLNDYKRMTAEIIKIISVQLTEQNDLEENDNDGTTESNDSTNS
jgi:formate dehydrogenase maturation protein FdhE